MYSIGDYVMKANTGVCKIDQIVMRSLAEGMEEKEYYVLIPVDDPRAKVFVPVASEKSNMRRAMGEQEAKDFIDSIPVIDVKWIENDKSREQEYKNAMRSNDPVHLVGIIKNLYLRNIERENQGKKVTAVDDRYFKMAENALNSELAHALGIKKDDIRELIAESIEMKAATG